MAYRLSHPTPRNASHTCYVARLWVDSEETTETNETTQHSKERNNMKQETAQHTPGPWTEFDGFIIARFSDGKVHDICDPRCAPPEGLEAEMDANARLIAAAPLLLEALKAVTEALGHIDDYGTASGGCHPDIQNNALDMAEKAIAFATQP